MMNRARDNERGPGKPPAAIDPINPWADTPGNTLHYLVTHADGSPAVEKMMFRETVIFERAEGETLCTVRPYDSAATRNRLNLWLNRAGFYIARDQRRSRGQYIRDMERGTKHPLHGATLVSIDFDTRTVEILE